MWKALKTSFKVQLITAMVSILFIPIIFGCIFTYDYFAKDHRQKTETDLKWLSKTKKVLLENFIAEQTAYLKMLAANPEIKKWFSQKGTLTEKQKEFFNKILLSAPVLSEIPLELVKAQNISVIYSNKITGLFSGSIFEQAVQKALRTNDVTISDVEFNALNNQAQFYIICPVVNNNRNAFGVVAAQIPQAHLEKILQSQHELKPELLVYLVEQKGRLIASSKPNKGLQSVNLTQFAKFNSCSQITDFEQNKAFACAIPLKMDHINANKFFVIAQISQTNYARPLKNLIIFFFILCFFLLLIGGSAAHIMGKRVSNPIVKVVNDLQAITSGKLNINVEVLKSQNEIGNLTQNLKRFVEHLKDQIFHLMENINIISSSSSEISATVAQLTAASSETASAITETASSAEEVSQLATSFNEKSKESIKVGEIAAEATNQGTEAFNKINQGIQNVKDQMSQVANMVIELSKQSQTIGEITEAVKEIAEQSNILAINASIEATKAGEYGRGFAVVANEVRNLADQSKKSAQQIQNILESIQESISKTVFRVEQTNTTIDHSVAFVQQAYDSMSKLSESIESVIQVLSEISKFAQEQLVGTSQIKEAMSNIKEATTQNLDGMHQLEEVINNLKTTSENLKSLISVYQVN